ncbi:MAG: ABC transporter ATP-binding protein [Saccharofermentanales bacterium]
MKNEPILTCDNLMKIYKTSDIEVIALQGLNLTVNRGEMVAIIGSSGSGKTTLLNIIGGLVTPSAGSIIVDGFDLCKMGISEKLAYKREVVGFVWQKQERNLLPYLTAIQNVELVMSIAGNVDKCRARQLLENVGLGDKLDQKLEELSGGEQQRVAIAIGICSNPRILLADEPTGSVDNATASDMMETFRHLQKELGLTIIIVTHDTKLAAKVDRVVLIRDGRTSSEFLKKTENGDDSEWKMEFGNTSHDEYIVLDNVGRLQIPLEFMEKAGLKGHSKIKLAMVEGNIMLLPVDKKTESK